jgi:hypothetical protein
VVGLAQAISTPPVPDTAGPLNGAVADLVKRPPRPIAVWSAVPGLTARVPGVVGEHDRRRVDMGGAGTALSEPGNINAEFAGTWRCPRTANRATVALVRQRRPGGPQRITVGLQR